MLERSAKFWLFGSNAEVQTPWRKNSGKNQEILEFLKGCIVNMERVWGPVKMSSSYTQTEFDVR